MKKVMNVVSNPPFNDESHYSEMKVGEYGNKLQILSRTMSEASGSDNVVYVLPKSLRFGKSLNERHKSGRFYAFPV